MLQQLYDGLDWIGTVASGLAAIAAAWGLLRLFPMQGRVLLGDWYCYSFFYAHTGTKFYRERTSIRRSRLWPWKLVQETRPAGAESQTVYRGPVYYHPPYVYTVAVEPDTGDMTFDLSRTLMDDQSRITAIVGIHLGNSFEESVHAASAYLWVRNQLDPTANEKLPPNDREEEIFRGLVAQFIQINRANFQLQLVPPQQVRRRSGYP